MNKTAFDVTKPVQTRDGRRAKIVVTDFDGNQPVIAVVFSEYKIELQRYYSNGRWTTAAKSTLDLVNIPVKREAWINFYPFSGVSGYAYPSRETADSGASINRFACVRVEFTEGQGL